MVNYVSQTAIVKGRELADTGAELITAIVAGIIAVSIGEGVSSAIGSIPIIGAIPKGIANAIKLFVESIEPLISMGLMTGFAAIFGGILLQLFGYLYPVIIGLLLILIIINFIIGGLSAIGGHTDELLRAAFGFIYTLTMIVLSAIILFIIEYNSPSVIHLHLCIPKTSICIPLPGSGIIYDLIAAVFEVVILAMVLRMILDRLLSTVGGRGGI